MMHWKAFLDAHPKSQRRRRMRNEAPTRPSRRQLLIRGGLAAGGLVSAGLAPITVQAAEGSPQHWDHEADVV